MLHIQTDGLIKYLVMAPCTHPGMKRIFCLKAKNGLGRFAPSALPHFNNMLNIIPTLYEGYIVSVHRMVMKNRPVDPSSIQGSHWPISFIRIKHSTRANDILWKLSINNHIVRLVHKTIWYERVWCTTQLAKLSFNHSHGRTHSWRFSTSYIVKYSGV